MPETLKDPGDGKGSGKQADDEILRSLVALYEPDDPSAANVQEEDFESLNDDQLPEADFGTSTAENDEDDEVLEVLAKLFRSSRTFNADNNSNEIELTKEDSVLEALAALFVGEDQQYELPEPKLSTGRNESANIPQEIFKRIPTGGIRFERSNGLEFVALIPTLPLKVSQLKCSARIFHDGMEIRLHNEGCLFLIDDTFKAEVELLHAVPVLSSASFAQAKTALFRQLCIGQIFVDKVMTTRDRLRAELLATINCIRKATDPADALQLYTIVQRAVSLNYMDFCELLYCTKATPRILREQAVKLLQIEQIAERRNRFLRQLHARFTNSSHELKATLTEFCAKVVENRANSLLDMAPHCLREQLKDIPQRNVFRMHDNDVKVFHDLDKVLNKEVFQKPLDDLTKRWINRVKSFKPSDAIVSVVNPIYFSLCRSLEELIVEIAGKTDHNPEELLLSNQSGWHALKTAIKWKKETSLTKCLQREYFFIIRLLKHFDPASGNTKPFEYKLRRLLGGAAKESMLSSFFRRLIGQTQQNPLGIADEFYVWFCLLDDVFHHVLPENDQILEIFEQILQNFILLLSKATFEQMEMIRVITHSVGRFIVQIFLFVSSDKAQSYEDKQILQSQLGIINRTMQGPESTKFFRDLIEVFSSYWKNRSSIIENIPLKNGLQEMEQIKKTLLAIVVVALRKNIDAGHVIDLFRVLNDFIVDLDDVSFDWLIKAVQGVAMSGMIDFKLIEPVDNKWNGTENQVYHVVEPNKFRQLQHVLLEGEPGPKHCVIDVVSTLLSCIHSQLDRTQWSSHERLSESDQILSSSALISSIRSTLIYLREQAEYVSFEMFLEERIDPFCKVLENSVSLSDFVKRVGMIKESFCYMRKQNEMSIAEALRMYGELNDEQDYSAELLQQAYQQYSDQFEAYMAEAVPEEDEKGKVGVVSKLLLESVRPILFKEWTAEFKQKELPKILAGVAAVWSTLVSADVSSTGKYFKPHCIQVLCVLRLLGADNGGKGVLKQLAQVLTGQGKSLVLVLMAAVLALTGHQVQLVCYNEYLVQRDAKDFAELLEVLNIEDRINYGTYADMAEKVISPEVNGRPKDLRSFVKDLILKEPVHFRSEKPKEQFLQNSVLLMDEVDIFFTKQYYGAEYRPGAFFAIPGLDKIQEQIWNLVYHQKILDVQKVTSQIKLYMQSPFFTGKAEFDQFLNRENTYNLNVQQGKTYVLKQFTNRSLFWGELKEMVKNAIWVASDASQYNNYRLNCKGVITYRSEERFGTTTIVGYTSVFNYFRLKQSNFKVKVGYLENYGYLRVHCGTISYAMLPKAYPLILGVTGTLTSLNHHEKAAIDRLYNINRSSIMPSFFGCSNLQFDLEQNFTHLPTKPLWMSRIFTRAHAAVAANRATIVFFYDDTLLEEFRAQYCGQFDRLQTLTENTEEDKHEHLISEAGVPKTVTLATRGMGRGVDYKSSVAVEKNGGVHVIQSFFSLDVKEETQIRGRTARKDNKGSYELIVFEGHLEEDELLDEGVPVTYAGLDAARTNISLRENKDIAESIEKNEINHLTTMEYLASFFK